MIDLDKVLELAILWAKETGKLQMSYFRTQNLGISTKSNISDVVTKVDKESERYLIESINKSFPSHDILGEETGMHKSNLKVDSEINTKIDREAKFDDNFVNKTDTKTGTKSLPENKYRWVLDPLDGTNNYSQGLPIFVVSIALQCNEKTIMGVVYAPYLDELYTAKLGEGAFRNGQKLSVALPKELGASILGTGFPYDKGENPDNNISNFSKLVPNIRGIRRMGAAAYDLCCVASGFLDGYWELNLHIWDICAAALLVEEAGGEVYHFRKDRGVSIIAGNSTIVKVLKDTIK